MEAVTIGVLLVFTFIATLVDIKKKEVPDFISYFLIIFGLGSNLIVSILQQNIWLIIWSVVGAAGFYAFGAALYYTGVWGGGDAKLLTGFGAILANFSNISMWPFLLTMLFNILLLGAVFGILGSLFLAVKNKKAFIEEARNLLKKYKYIIYVLWASLIVVAVFIYIASMLPILFWSLAVLLFYLTIGLKSVENVCMYKEIKPSKLVEGDWLAEEIRVAGKLIYKPKAEGISQEYINKLVDLEKKGKLKRVTVKEGFAYVPAFLVALIVTLLGYDLMFIIFSTMIH